MVDSCWLIRYNAIDIERHFPSKIEINVIKQLRVCLVDVGIVAMAEFEGYRRDKVNLLVGHKRIVKSCAWS